MSEWDYNTLIRPLLTEKTTRMEAYNQYAFEVHPKSSVPQIKKAVEAVFGVKVMSVNTLNMKGEVKYRGRRKFTTKPWKKAYVTCAEGTSIALFEN